MFNQSSLNNFWEES